MYQVPKTGINYNILIIVLSFISYEKKISILLCNVKLTFVI